MKAIYGTVRKQSYNSSKKKNAEEATGSVLSKKVFSKTSKVSHESTCLEVSF